MRERDRLARVIRPLVEGQIRTFGHAHPSVADAVDWKHSYSTKLDALVASVAKRVTTALLSDQTVWRLRSALSVGDCEVDKHELSTELAEAHHSSARLEEEDETSESSESELEKPPARTHSDSSSITDAIAYFERRLFAVRTCWLCEGDGVVPLTTPPYGVQKCDRCDGAGRVPAIDESESEHYRVLLDLVRRQADALAPFASAADIRLCGDWRDDQPVRPTDVAWRITFGDLRRARATRYQT